MSSNNPKILELYKVENKFIFQWTVNFYETEHTNLKTSFSFEALDDCFVGNVSVETLETGLARLVLCIDSEDKNSKAHWNIMCDMYYNKEKCVNWSLSRNLNTKELYLHYNHNEFSKMMSCSKHFGWVQDMLFDIYPEKIEKKSKLSADLEQLLETKTFCNVTLEVAGKEFQAHKSILSCRSPVFGAMFQHQMSEAISNKVLIEDIEPEIFEELLRFIYTDRVSNINPIAFKLLPAADKYGLQGLTSICEQQLINTISVENVADILLTADLYGMVGLKAIAKEFITKNKKAVSALESWHRLLEKSHLIAEMFLEN